MSTTTIQSIIVQYFRMLPGRVFFAVIITFLMIAHAVSAFETKFSYQGSEVEISTDFDNGALASVIERSANTFDIWPYRENEYMDGALRLQALIAGTLDHANFSFHFRASGCKNKHLTFLIHLLERQFEGGSSIVYANPDFPVFSYDGVKWFRAKTKSLLSHETLPGWSTIRVEQTFDQDTVFVAYQYPYSNTALNRFLDRVGPSLWLTDEQIGQSGLGIDIHLITITDPSIPRNLKKVVWIHGLLHSAELAAGWGIQGMMDYLLSDSPNAKTARERYIFKFIPVVNVNANTEGRGRISYSSRDVLRIWEDENPTVGVKAILDAMDRWVSQGNSIDIFFDIHGFSTTDGSWGFLPLPYDTIPFSRVSTYHTLVNYLQNAFPGGYTEEDVSEGYPIRAVYRRYGTYSVSIDGWVYRFATWNRIPDLSSYYTDGQQIPPLEDIFEAGARFVDTLVRYSDILMDAESAGLSPRVFFVRSYPNPFNASAVIHYFLPFSGSTRIEIFSSSGQLVRTLFSGIRPAGFGSLSWDGLDYSGRALGSGLFFSRLTIGNHSIAGKMLLLR